MNALPPIDLIEEITNLLAEAKHPSPNAWKEKLDTDKVRQGTSNLDHQRIAINRYWQNQLLTVPIGTMRERLLLRYSGSDIDYLELFKQSVLPTIIKYNLG